MYFIELNCRYTIHTGDFYSSIIIFWEVTPPLHCLSIDFLLFHSLLVFSDRMLAHYNSVPQLKVGEQVRFPCSPGRPNGEVGREAGCCTRGSGFESRVRHGSRAVCLDSTSSCAQNLVDERCQVQSPVALVDLAVRSFPWFFPKIA